MRSFELLYSIQTAKHPLLRIRRQLHHRHFSVASGRISPRSIQLNQSTTETQPRSAPISNIHPKNSTDEQHKQILSKYQTPKGNLPIMALFQDDKTPICVPFILELLQSHNGSQPFVVGLNGVQGAGKTTLVSALAEALEKENVPTLVCSIDDFYLNHTDLIALGRQNPDNALVQHRGEPGTHDIALAKSVFDAVMQGQPTKVPVYDKSAFSGHGDRTPESQWRPVNQPGQPRIKAVILEGWSVGFRPLSLDQVEAKWKAPSRTLQQHKLEHLLFINEKLRAYEYLTDLFEAFVHIDAEDLNFVYGWRAQQEEHLRRDKGDPNAGMSPEQVVKFVDGYFPAYELYTSSVRSGVIPKRPGHQLRLLVDQNRKVKEVTRI